RDCSLVRLQGPLTGGSPLKLFNGLPLEPIIQSTDVVLFAETGTLDQSCIPDRVQIPRFLVEGIDPFTIEEHVERGAALMVFEAMEGLMDVADEMGQKFKRFHTFVPAPASIGEDRQKLFNGGYHKIAFTNRHTIPILLLHIPV